MQSVLIKIGGLVVGLLALISLCAPASAGEVTQVRIELAGKLDDTLDAFVAAHPELPGAMVALRSERMSLRYAGAAGFTSRDGTTPLTADAPVRLASVTKSYVAATVLRLVEANKIDLGAPIGAYLSPETLSTLDAGGVLTRDITVRHLLSHTAGLADHSVDTNYIALVRETPNREWTRLEQVRLAAALGQHYGPPGYRYHYSDTGYVLLGEIIERRTKQSLASAVREQIGFAALGLEATWWEQFESPPKHLPPRPAQYFGDIDIRATHPSLDLFGGGGLVANVDDVARFYAALFTGDVFAQPRTLEIMRTVRVPDVGGTPRYTLGLAAFGYDDYTVFAHFGAWGGMGGYIPALDLAFGWAANNAGEALDYSAGLYGLIQIVIDGSRNARAASLQNGQQETPALQSH